MSFKQDLENLANQALVNHGIDGNYSEQDLQNATLVFQEVFMSALFKHYKGKLDLDQMCIIGKESGKSFQQYVKLFTGIDLHDIIYHNRPYL